MTPLGQEGSFLNQAGNLMRILFLKDETRASPGGLKEKRLIRTGAELLTAREQTLGVDQCLSSTSSSANIQGHPANHKCRSTFFGVALSIFVENIGAIILRKKKRFPPSSR